MVLCRKLENVEGKMVYTTRGKCSVYSASRVSVFFLKKVFECRRLCRKFGLIIIDLFYLKGRDSTIDESL